MSKKLESNPFLGWVALLSRATSFLLALVFFFLPETHLYYAIEASLSQNYKIKESVLSKHAST
jgi:hypothetical protein